MNEEQIITSNNGRGHNLNPADYYSDHFYHRTQTEALITRVCIQKNLLFAPLVVFSVGNRKRREIDHLLCKDSYMLLQEIDGPSHNEETMFEAEERLKIFRQNGFFILRYKQPDFPDLAWATSVVEESLEFIDKMVAIYGRRS